jgi:hypothetical protein
MQPKAAYFWKVTVFENLCAGAMSFARIISLLCEKMQ